MKSSAGSLALLLTAVTGIVAADLPALMVSENHRFPVQEDGAPFFWLGDTAWKLFHRLDREQVTRSLNYRQAKGFTVFQAVALSNPRTGEADAISEFGNQGEREFMPPEPREGLDWVLVLDDASKKFPHPGTRP